MSTSLANLEPMLVYDGKCEMNRVPFSHVQKHLGDGASLQYTLVSFEVAEHPLGTLELVTSAGVFWNRGRNCDIVIHRTAPNIIGLKAEDFCKTVTSSLYRCMYHSMLSSTYETALFALRSKITTRMCSNRGRTVTEFQCIEQAQAVGLFLQCLMCIP